MRGRGWHGVQGRVWPLRHPKVQENLPDPNRPGSPDYAERHRESSYRIGGLQVVSYGAPCETPGRVVEFEAEPEVDAPVSLPDAVEVQAATSAGAPTDPRDWRKDYGLGRG